MSNTIHVLRAESSRLRQLADRIDGLADELAASESSSSTSSSSSSASLSSDRERGQGEYAGLTQKAAILKALSYGPQSTRQIYERLNKGGLEIKKPTYITALLGRLKDQIERTQDGKLQLRQ